MKQRLVDFSDPILSAALFILLKDRTTGKNIIWATEPPPELGAGFSDEITLEQIKKCPPAPRPVLEIFVRVHHPAAQNCSAAVAYSLVVDSSVSLHYFYLSLTHNGHNLNDKATYSYNQRRQAQPESII